MLRRVPLIVDEFYHVFNRGVDKRQIFYSNADYLRFLHLLYLANSDKQIDYGELEVADIFNTERGEPIVAVCGYCIMPNHFHLLIKEIKNGGITAFMRKLCTAYCMYFNKKYDHSGVLLQGRFKSKHADKDEYLKHLLTYIHLNHLDLFQSGWKEAGVREPKLAEKFLIDYQYSSLCDYVGEKDSLRSKILNFREFPGYYDSVNEMITDLRDWQEIIPMMDAIAD